MLSTRIRLLKEVVGLRQTWILGMVSAFGSWALDIWVSTSVGYMGEFRSERIETL
ncbi:hypothetical protein RirG_255970 [Rhizophagus irregularis DAOM 197198w]|uniref:Uncharacterized protein n=1 Tax=Rhizophagus irregularis (strain DAOM 197198w) TaxID=1432141 RepID=A0A015IDV4_RHIIW|nr:hypothetical protein RirG_255970 [Rhizophagus irregularis DAOM 197198w]